MATLLLWSNFNKRKNSTLQPDPNAATSRTVKLKDDCSLNAPVFLLASPSDNWNYCQYEGKYYFIDDIVRTTNTQAEIHCTQDHLATYKSYILNTSAYVLFYDHVNTEVSDKRLATKTTKTLSVDTGSFDALGVLNPWDCVVIISTVGESSTKTYAMTMANVVDLLNSIDNWYENASQFDQKPDVASWTDVDDFFKWAAGQIWEWGRNFAATGSAMDAITSAHILPIKLGDISGSITSEVILGKYKTGINAKMVNNRTFHDDSLVTIPWQASDWRRNAPYHEIFLYIPYVGLVTISPSDVIGESNILVSVSLDIMSGDTIFKVYVQGTNHVLGQYNTNLSGSYPIGRSNVSPSQVGTSLLSAGIGVTAAVATGGITAALGGTAAISGLLNAISSQPTCIGGASGGAALDLDQHVVCFTIFHDTIQAPSSLSAAVGTPFNGAMSLSGISGYVQTAAASVNMPGFGNDKDIVNSLLDGGVYIE